MPQSALPRKRPTGVRWTILAILFALSFVAYLTRYNVSIAAEAMMPDLGISTIQMGWIFSAMLIGYTLFQLPGGVFGDRFGPRRALSVIALLWVVLTVLTGLIPGQLTAIGSGALVSLLIIRFLMGVVHAPLFPTIQGAIEEWFPPGNWALPTGIAGAGLSLGGAVAGPLVAWVMVTLGWRESFYFIVPITLIVIAIWWWFATDSPTEHPNVGRRELALIRGEREEAAAEPDAIPGLWKQMLRHRDILLLTLSYTAANWVFYTFWNWFYIYLVDVRELETVVGGFAAASSWIIGAPATVVGGLVCDLLWRRFGARWSCRLLCMVALIGAGVLLLAGSFVTHALAAVILLSCAFAGFMFTDAIYWAAATQLGGRHTPVATGILNTGGNLIGIVNGPLVPILAERFGWAFAMASGALFALVAALLWWGVRADNQFTADQ